MTPFARMTSLACLGLALLAGCSKTAITDETQAADGATAKADEAAATEVSAEPDIALLSNPADPAMNVKAPDVFKVRFETTKGDVIIEVHRDWAPHGADRFYNLTRHHFFDGVKFFRVLPGFMAQFGIHGNPKVARPWSGTILQDDPVTQSNTRGMITYANTGMPDSRSTQLFINYGNNKNLDGQRFAPFGKVLEGMDVMDSLYAKYGAGPSAKQGDIQKHGNAFLDQNYPELDSIISSGLVD
jgi:peptidyl-prolyl cis-trans isomerase A (cyclophilin A)